MAKHLEPTRGPHHPWIEVVSDGDFNWQPQPGDTYTGHAGGGTHRPSNGMLDSARSDSLVEMFLFVVPLSLLEYISERTRAYAYEDWVVPTPRLDREGNATKRPILTQVFPEKDSDVPPNARHRWMPGPGHRQLNISPYFVITWLGILMVAGAYFKGDNNHGIKAIYKNPPYGISVPFIQNAMPFSAFVFLRNNIHFSDARHRKPKGHKNYDPSRVHIPTGFQPEFRIPRNFRSFSPESIPMTF